MINSDQIHVAMTKTCGMVVTLACQSNTFYKKKTKTIELLRRFFYFLSFIFDKEGYNSFWYLSLALKMSVVTKFLSLLFYINIRHRVSLTRGIFNIKYSSDTLGDYDKVEYLRFHLD
jgi:hypothetical protein